MLCCVVLSYNRDVLHVQINADETHNVLDWGLARTINNEAAEGHDKTP